MKITILDAVTGEEDEVIVKCHELSDELVSLLQKLKQGDNKLMGYGNDGICLMNPDEVYYFETVDSKVFAYCREEVNEVKEKLYELEESLPAVNFMRVSKSVILNLTKIKKLSPAFSGRFEAILDNGEKIIISRQYVPGFKERLGL